MAGHGSLLASDPQAQLGNQLFFDAFVRGYVEQNPRRFVRRDWLAEELDGKLHEPGKRFVLLTAEPGAGKSAFMAQLARDHPDWLRYFIRRDQREVLADVSARSLLLRVGYQLAAFHPELFSKDRLTLPALRVAADCVVAAVVAKRIAWAAGSTAAAISARCRFIASVLQAGRIRAAPLPCFGQTAPKM